MNLLLTPFLTGAVKKTSGSRTYPVEYTYDAQCRKKTMKTWRKFAANSGTAVTTWNCDNNRAFLLSKDYADPTTGAAGSVGPDYTYTAGGRLKTRTWARNHCGGSRIVTTYKYGFDIFPSVLNFADMKEVSYNDSVTPTTTYGYDRRGRQVELSRAGMATTRTLNDAGMLLSESYSLAGTLVGLSVNATYDSYLHRQPSAPRTAAQRSVLRPTATTPPPDSTPSPTAPTQQRTPTFQIRR